MKKAHSLDLKNIACNGFERNINLDIEKLGHFIDQVYMTRKLTIPYRQICIEYVMLMKRLETIEPEKMVQIEAELGLYKGKKTIGNVDISKLEVNPIFKVAQ